MSFAVLCRFRGTVYQPTLLGKQFRALEEDEVLFLDAVREKERKDERTRRDKDSEEVDAFKQCAITLRSMRKKS